MLNIYDEIAGPAKIIRTKINWQPRRDYWGLLGRLVKPSLVYLLVAVVAFGFFRFSHRYILQTVQVAGCSMSPTLLDAKCYLLNRVVYLIRDPEAKEIVVLQDPEDKSYAVKRIVARPGDGVYMANGCLFVNGKLLQEPYLEPGTKTYTSPRYRAQMWICGVNQYFVLGDNRNNSVDSRAYGAVPRRNILGMVTP
jgi:signal peptidase I